MNTMQDRYHQWHRKAIEAAERGDWDSAISFGMNVPPHWDVWQQFPSAAGEAGMPDEAVHKILDIFAKHPKHEEYGKASFLFEYASNLPEHAGPDVLNRIANAGMEDGFVTERVEEHPNYRPDEKTAGLQGAGRFWNDYERKVRPHHFATIQHHKTGQPVEGFTDHRGETGHSKEFEHVLPHLDEHAKLVQDAVLKEAREGYGDGYRGPKIELKHIKGEPHVRVFRGINGDYADAIARKANLNHETGEVDRKTLTVPITHMSSWTIDPQVAQNFARGRNNIENQAKRPLLIEKWLPVKDILHSGFHTVHAGQDHVHRHEHELVFGAPTNKMKVPATSLHVVHDGDGATKVRARRAAAPAAPETPEMTMAKAELNLVMADAVRHHQVASDMLGTAPRLGLLFEAARFLTGGKAIPMDQARKALWYFDGDAEAAALAAYQLPINEENRQAIQGIVKLNLAKSEPSTYVPQSVIAMHDSGKDAAEAVMRAYKDNFAFPVTLSGKHSKGSIILRDEATHSTWLIKPGHGGPGPSAGSKEESATPTTRESAFYAVAKDWKLQDYLPRAEEISIDGQKVAVFALLPWVFKTVDEVRKLHPDVVKATFDQYLGQGVLHQLAVMDYVLGNPDRHANNIMIDGDQIRLIDHGSAFAGDSFDPVYDKKSFVPYYLRYRAPEGWMSLAPQERYAYIPRIETPEGLDAFSTWFEWLDPEALRQTLKAQGIDPEPSVRRLLKLKLMAKKMPVDEAVAIVWSMA